MGNYNDLSMLFGKSDEETKINRYDLENNIFAGKFPNEKSNGKKFNFKKHKYRNQQKCFDFNLLSELSLAGKDGLENMNLCDLNMPSHIEEMRGRDMTMESAFNRKQSI